MSIPARHDALFKFTFSNVRHAASALSAVLPARITTRFGALDDETTARFEALDLEGLATIYAEIFTAETVDALLDRAAAASRTTEPA
jgi:hypothetical protein